MTKNYILVVDDEIDILTAIQLGLGGEGYTVTTSKTVDAAENLDNQCLPSLVILDVSIAGKDGRDICKKLKSNKNTKHIPVIMISAHTDISKSVKEAGANDFIPKPFELTHLLATVEKYISS